MSSKIYTHWGDKDLSCEKFLKIKNHGFLNKPIGGLWASPPDTPKTWLDWVIENEFNTTLGENKYIAKNSFRFKLKDDTKLLIVNTYSDIDSLPKLNNGKGLFSDLGQVYINWEKLSKIYDAILINVTNDYNLFTNFREFDVDSLIVFNLDKVEIV